MALSNSQFRLAPTGHVYVAPLGSPVPTDVTTAWNAAWNELGYLDDTGVAITPKTTYTAVSSWQSGMVNKEVPVSQDMSLAFNLQQTNAFNLSLYFFGVAWTTSGGINTLSVPSAFSSDERMLGVEWTDSAATFTYRMVIPRGIATSRTKIDINRKTVTMYGLTFEALDNNGSAYTILSN